MPEKIYQVIRLDAWGKPRASIYLPPVISYNIRERMKIHCKEVLCLREYTVIAAITNYLDIVKYTAGNNLYGLLFAAGSPGTEQVMKYEAKNDDDAIFKGAMMAKEKGFF